MENDWVSAGHTSPGEIRRLGHDPLAPRDRADRIAGAFVAALGGSFHPRQSAAP